MWLNNLKIAFRGFARNKTFTLLNLLSLMAGLFVAYVGISYLSFEKSYDQFHADSENIYRLARSYRSQDYSVIGFPNWNGTEAQTQLDQAEILKSATGVTEVTQFITSPYTEFITSDQKEIGAEGILTTNTPAAFIKMFTWRPILGELEAFATGSKKLILTHSLAENLFGTNYRYDESIINSAIKIANEDYVLAAVIKDVPKNSHFDFNLALSENRLDYWGSRIYVQSAQGVSLDVLNQGVNEAFAGFNPQLAADPLYKGHFLQPIESIHLESNILYELKQPGNKTYILLISFFAFFILIISIFNYANLTLAIKSKEGKSIGVRKAMGAQNSSIAAQFLFEGVLLALIALPLTGILIAFLISPFNDLMGVEVASNIFLEPSVLLILVSLAVLVGLLAGLSPAIYLGMQGTISLFKSSIQEKSFQQFTVRKYLVISQFVILIGISSVSVFITQQMNFVENKDLGFRRDGIVYVETSPDKLDVFQQSLRQIPGVIQVGNGSSFGLEPFNQGTYKIEGSETIFDDSNEIYLDFEAFEAYEIESSLSEVPKSRTTLINRTAAEKLAAFLGVNIEELIGKEIVTEPEYVDEESGQVGFPFTIAGIFEDIHLFSLHEKVAPYFLTLSESVRMGGQSIISYNTNSEVAVLQAIEREYAKLEESFPLELQFLKDNVQQLYEQDKQTATLVFYFNVIAIFAAALGIIGVTIFLTVARTKEIGIRKVLGASVFSIVKSSTREYMLLVLIAFVLAVPLGYLAVSTWLANFAYRIAINPLIFFGVGALVLIFTAGVVGSIAFNAAQANPVNSIKAE
ncbi:FtsX-like permease family protein [Algoriphagus namhaensis]|uniref:FtsX-like permease family protein n=1 Tax=Algoriphagus namhaensis TaxID=915353 RepID=A0ABV8AVT5_9BACT